MYSKHFGSFIIFTEAFLFFFCLPSSAQILDLTGVLTAIWKTSQRKKKKKFFRKSRFFFFFFFFFLLGIANFLAVNSFFSGICHFGTKTSKISGGIFEQKAGNLLSRRKILVKKEGIWASHQISKTIRKNLQRSFALPIVREH